MSGLQLSLQVGWVYRGETQHWLVSWVSYLNPTYKVDSASPRLPVPASVISLLELSKRDKPNFEYRDYFWVDKRSQYLLYP